MDKTIAFILSCVLAFILGGVAGFWVVRQIVNAPVETLTVSDTVTVTDRYESVRYYPMPELIVMPPFPADIDTPAVVNAYYTQKLYTDTLVNNDKLIAVVEDTVSENRIQSRRFHYELRYPVITHTTTTTRQPTFQAAVLMDSRSAISLQVEYRRMLVQGGYNLRERDPSVAIGYKFLIR